MIDIVSIGNIAKDAAIIIGVPVVRAVAGWAPKALADNRIVHFEWKQLAQTVIRVGTMGTLAYIGFSIGGIDNAAVAGAIAGFFADKLFNALKKNKNVKPGA